MIWLALLILFTFLGCLLALERFISWDDHRKEWAAEQQHRRTMAALRGDRG